MHALMDGIVETAFRTILIYAFTLALVRLASRRAMGKGAAMDIVVAIMLGSIMSDGIDGNTAFIPVVVAGVVLVGMHWLLAAIAFRTNWFGPIVKGDRVLLIKNGTIQEDGMKEAQLHRMI